MVHNRGATYSIWCITTGQNIIHLFAELKYNLNSGPDLLLYLVFVCRMSGLSWVVRVVFIRSRSVIVEAS
jgi:hypothetical protein